MKLKHFVAVGLLALSAAAVAQVVATTVSWFAVTQFTDGTAIPVATPVSYIVEWGSAPTCDFQTALLNKITTTSLSTGRTPSAGSKWCFKLTAVADGVLSDATYAVLDLSAVPPPPPPPKKKPMAPVGITFKTP